MGGTAKRIGLGVATGGMSELERAGVGPSAALGGGTGGKSGKNGGPTPPDFNAAAQTQAESSLQNTREQTAANRPDQSGPFGSSTWSQGPDGRWSQQTSLAPGLQGAADNLMGQIGAGSSLDPGQARDQAIQAAYSQATSRLDPQWAQRESSLQNRLANQGFSLTDEASRAATGDLGRERNDAYQQAMYGAQTGAGNAAFGQALAANNQPYQQLSQIRGLSQPSSFTAAGQADPVQSLAAAMQRYSGDLQSYGIDQQGKNSTMGGLAGLAPLLMKAGI